MATLISKIRQCWKTNLRILGFKASRASGQIFFKVAKFEVWCFHGFQFQNQALFSTLLPATCLATFLAPVAGGPRGPWPSFAGAASHWAIFGAFQCWIWRFGAVRGWQQWQTPVSTRQYASSKLNTTRSGDAEDAPTWLAFCKLQSTAVPVHRGRNPSSEPGDGDNISPPTLNRRYAESIHPIPASTSDPGARLQWRGEQVDCYQEPH